jgi:hypothetical protein
MLMAKRTRAKKGSARKGAATVPAPQKPPMEAAPKAEKPAAPESAPVPMAEPAAREPEAKAVPAATPQAVAAPEPHPATAKPASARRERGGLMKGFAIIALLAAAFFLAYYFITLPENAFVPGSEVDAETFKNIFLHSQNVFIVMDVRGVSSDVVSNNILQCGVDFASSNGMGGKVVTPVSFGNSGCVAPDGEHKPKECFSMLKDGITIYVKEGPGGARYYSNGMVVQVGSNYSLGTCGIKAY